VYDENVSLNFKQSLNLMATLQQIYPHLKNELTGKSIQCCARGCRRVARHIHHNVPRCEGGTDDTLNLSYLCQRCHVAHHSSQGDFSLRGSIGGQITAEKMVSIPNLKQFQGAAGHARWMQYCERKANAQMGVQ